MALTDGDKRCSCGAGHETFGACMRAKNIQTQTPGAHSAVKAWDNRLADFARAATNGLVPKTTGRQDVAKALNTLRNTKD